MLKNWILISLLITLALTGCAKTAHQTTKETADLATKATPQEVLSQGDDFFVFSHLERHYVVGSEESRQKFAAHHHLPYTKTVLGAGPKGETVVFEVAKKDPQLVERLMETYNGTPFQVSSNGDDYTVFKYQGRLFVIGQPETRDSFRKHHHLPYTKTLLGAGPSGETVIFEVDKKDPKLVERLIEEFKG